VRYEGDIEFGRNIGFGENVEFGDFWENVGHGAIFGFGGNFGFSGTSGAALARVDRIVNAGKLYYVSQYSNDDNMKTRLWSPHPSLIALGTSFEISSASTYSGNMLHPSIECYQYMDNVFNNRGVQTNPMVCRHQ